VRAVVRRRPDLLRLAALALAVIGALLLLLGLARATVWAPPTQSVARVTGQPGVPVVTSTGGALDLEGPSVRIDVRGSDPAKPVFVGVGRSSDVAAFLGDAARLEVSGGVSGDPTTGRGGTQTTLPEPAGVDVWALQATHAGTVSLTWPRTPGRWRLVAAVDGATPPAQVVLTWERPRSSSPAPVLLGVGALLLVLGLVGLRAAATRTAPAAAEADGDFAMTPGPPTGRRAARLERTGRPPDGTAGGKHADGERHEGDDGEVRPAPFRSGGSS
jgi:hypothetical protein